jgi:Ni2+-binding GTPase involved in maturation of urease and hydrogenase
MHMSFQTIIVSGTPSSGKTKIILCLLQGMFIDTAGVVKLDCLATDDDVQYEKRSIPSLKLIAGTICPDHYLIEQLPAIRAWTIQNRLKTVLIETAGLCARCAPYVSDTVSICVLDGTAGIHMPRKLGPLLTDADICVLTKGDLISPTEREVFTANVHLMNDKAVRIWVNGITGEGTPELARAMLLRSRRLRNMYHISGKLRTPLPRMYCSHCFGNMYATVTAG